MAKQARKSGPPSEIAKRLAEKLFSFLTCDSSAVLQDGRWLETCSWQLQQQKQRVRQGGYQTLETRLEQSDVGYLQTRDQVQNK